MGFEQDFVKQAETINLGALGAKELNGYLHTISQLDRKLSALFLDECLKKLVAASLNSDDLCERLVLFFEPIESISREMFENYDDPKFELITRRAELFFSRDLLLQFADVLYGLIDSKKLTLDKSKGYFSAVLFALDAYSLALLRTYQLGMYAPKGIWKKLYELNNKYRQCEKKSANTLLEIVNVPLGRTDANAFYSLVLLVTLSPYQMKAAEQEDIFQFFLKAARSSDFSDKVIEGGLHFYEPSKDVPPVSFQYNRMAEAGAVYIDTLALIKTVEEGKVVLTESAKNRILHFWQSPQVRREGRYKTEGKLGVIYGLKALHRYSRGRRGIAQAVDELEKRVAEGKSSPADGNVSERLVKYYKNALFVKDGILATAQDVSEWYIDNCSLTGAFLTNESESEIEELEMGRVVGLKGIGAQGLTAALIRWIHHQDRGGVAMGIEYVARKIINVDLQSESEAKKDIKSPGFLASRTYARWPEELVLCPVALYQVGDVLQVYEGKSTKSVKLVACVEETFHCMVFTYKEI